MRHIVGAQPMRGGTKKVTKTINLSPVHGMVKPSIPGYRIDDRSMMNCCHDHVIEAKNNQVTKSEKQGGIDMRLWAILFAGALTALGVSVQAATDRTAVKWHPPSAIQKFTSNPYYCNQMLDDRDSGDSLSAEFSKGLGAAMKETRKPSNVAVKEVQSLCEKRAAGIDLARVKSNMGR